jgi:hypothetical protein
VPLVPLPIVNLVPLADSLSSLAFSQSQPDVPVLAPSSPALTQSQPEVPVVIQQPIVVAVLPPAPLSAAALQAALAARAALGETIAQPTGMATSSHQRPSALDQIDWTVAAVTSSQRDLRPPVDLSMCLFSLDRAGQGVSSLCRVPCDDLAAKLVHFLQDHPEATPHEREVAGFFVCTVSNR